MQQRLFMITAMSTPHSDRFDKGLANTIAAESAMSYIDGANGVLEYVGLEIDALARNSTFEEVVYLLWHQKLPTRSQLDRFVEDIHAEHDLPQAIWDMMSSLPVSAAPMHTLRTLVSALSLHDPEADDQSPAANQRKAIRLLAKTPVLIANLDRHRGGKDFVKPDPSLGIATGFLTMLSGTKPTKTMAQALDVCLILHADHGFNASTFAALVTISTLSDMYSAVTTAIGTLKGPLHGGANEAVMRMLHEIGEVSKVEAYITGKLRRKEKVMGFGHRVYKVYDPRAAYLKTFGGQLAEDTGNQTLFDISKAIDELMHEKVASKGIHPNVDFYSATTYYSIGLAVDLFTPIFVMSRIAGWVGHCIEYLASNKLMRPRCEYVGPHDQPYVPIENR